MGKLSRYYGGGNIKGEPDKPVKSTIDRTKYTKQLSVPISGIGTNVVGNNQFDFTPDVLKNMGYNYVSGTMGGKDIVYEKGGNYHIYNEQPNNATNKYGLINIGNPFAVNQTIQTTPTPVTTNPLVTPVVDPNHKPLNFGNPNLVYDPNTGNYKDNVTGKFIEPVVQQYKKGGKVLSKYYAEGGNVPLTDPNKQKGLNPQTVQGLGSTVYGLSQSMYQPNNNQNPQLNGTIDSTAGALTPWYGLAKGASNIGRSQLNRDKYGNPEGNFSRAADEFIAPQHENAINAYNREGVSGALKEFFTPAALLRGGANLLGKGDETSGTWGKINNFSGNTGINKDRNTNIAAMEAQDAIRAEELNRQKRLMNEGRIGEAILARNLGETSYEDSFLQDQRNRRNKIQDIVNKTGGQFMKDGGQVNMSLKDKFRKAFAKGGEIKGPGTGKSDSINAKMKPGTFIVPQENAAVAKKIGKEMFDHDDNEKAELNDGKGVSIKVSNGEYKFSPEERQEIINELGEEFLEHLAPNAEHESEAMKSGGLTPEKARTILKDGQIRGKAITDKQRRYFGYISNGHKCGGMVKGYAGGGSVDGDFESILREIASQEAKMKLERDRSLKDRQYKIQQEKNAERRAKLLEEQRQYENTLKQRESALKYKKEKVNNLFNQYKSAPETTTNFVKAKQNYIPELKAAIKDYQDTYYKYNPNDSESSKPVSVDTGNRMDYMQGKNVNLKDTVKQFPTFTPSTTTQLSKRPLKSNTGQNKSVLTTGNTLPLDSIFSRNWAQTNEGPSEVPTPIVTDTSTPSVNPLADQNNIIQSNNPAATNTPNQPGSNKSKFDYNNILGGLVNYGIPAFQTYMGFKNLKDAGQRPKDQLDADYLRALNKEKQNVLKADQMASYGFTPEERALANMQNQNLTNAGRYSARNLTGGSAANALGAERAVLNDAFGRSLQTSVNDRNLQLQKQQAAFDRQENLNSLVEDKQNRLRQYFNNDLDAWHQKTQSASSLAATGLSNALDAYRANERLKNFNQQMNQANNPYSYNQ